MKLTISQNAAIDRQVARHFCREEYRSVRRRHGRREDHGRPAKIGRCPRPERAARLLDYAEVLIAQSEQHLADAFKKVREMNAARHREFQAAHARRVRAELEGRERA